MTGVKVPIDMKSIMRKVDNEIEAEKKMMSKIKDSKSGSKKKESEGAKINER